MTATSLQDFRPAGRETSDGRGRQPATVNAHSAKGMGMSNDTPQLVISQVAAETIRVPVVGTTPLIVSRFSEKAKRAILDKQQGRRAPKRARDPQAEYEASLYLLKDGSYGLPTLAFKAATVGGARFYHGVKMTELRQSIFFHGEVGNDGQQLSRIEGEPRMREDAVRLAGRSSGSDLRYRAEFPEWTSLLDVTYVVSALTRESLLSLIDAGGMGVGVGEWRPERKGEFGTFRVDPTRDVEVIDR